MRDVKLRNRVGARVGEKDRKVLDTQCDMNSQANYIILLCCHCEHMYLWLTLCACAIGLKCPLTRYAIQHPNLKYSAQVKVGSIGQTEGRDNREPES